MRQGALARIFGILNICYLRRKGRAITLLPKWIEIIPLQRIAFENGCKIGGKTSGTIMEVCIAFLMCRHYRALWRKAKKMIMPSAFAQIENVHERRTGNRGHDISADGEMCV